MWRVLPPNSMLFKTRRRADGRGAVNRSRAHQRDSRARKIAERSGADANGHFHSELLPAFVTPTAILVSTGMALLIALTFGAQWDAYLRFRYGGSFGLADPLFGADVGFYVFRLPYYELLQGSLLVLTIRAARASSAANSS